MNKRRFFIVMQREYYALVAKKSFIISTLLVPILMLGLMFIPALLMQVNKSDALNVAVVDLSEKYGSALTDSEDYTFNILKDTSTADIKDRYDEADGDIYAIVVIPKNVETTHQVNIYSESTIKHSLSQQVEDDLDKALSDAKIASYNIPELDRIVKDSQISVSVKSHTWNSDGDSVSSSSGLAMIIGLILSFLTYIFVIMYGAMIMSSVVEDKTNRIVEVIVSTCKPIELMLGKIISVGLVGLTQIAIWSVLLGIGLFILSISGIVPEPASTTEAMGEVEPSEMGEILQALVGINWWKMLGVFVLYFIGGYLLYASLFAAFGSAVDQQSDASQYMTPVMMIIVLALLIGEACMENPDSTLGVVSSFVPFTSPIVMMIRLPYDVPAWQILSSLVLLYATALLLVWIASKIYRTGILMYGRKVSFKEILRWVK